MTSEPVIPAPAPQDPAFVQHLAAMCAHFQPVGAFEETLVHQISTGIWRLQRCAAAEEGIFAADSADTPGIPNNPGRTWLEKGKAINALSLYEGRLRRALEKDKAELRAVQNERKAIANSGSSDFISSAAPDAQPSHPIGAPNHPDAHFALGAEPALAPRPLPSSAVEAVRNRAAAASAFIASPDATVCASASYPVR